MGKKAMDSSEELARARHQAVMAVSAFCAAALQLEKLTRGDAKITVGTAKAAAQSDEGALAMMDLARAIACSDPEKLRAMSSKWMAAARARLGRCRDARMTLARDAAVSVEEAWGRARR